MLDRLGVPWHEAPAEAEAECAKLSELGIVDAVWTEDSDALMFGAKLVIRFLRISNNGENHDQSGKKDLTKVRVCRSKDIFKKYPYLDRKGLVLFTVLSGGDYGKGIENCGPQIAIRAAAQPNLAKHLCSASAIELPSWRSELVGHFATMGIKCVVRPEFPDPVHIKQYNEPLVSGPYALKHIQETWDAPINTPKLWPFLAERFNQKTSDFVGRILPIFLVRSLAQTPPGGEASNRCYDLQRISQDSFGTSTVSFDLSVPLCDTTVNSQDWLSAYKTNKQTTRVAGVKMLDCILRHSIPDLVDLPQADNAISTKKRGRPKKTQDEIGTTAIKLLHNSNSSTSRSVQDTKYKRPRRTENRLGDTIQGTEPSTNSSPLIARLDQNTMSMDLGTSQPNLSFAEWRKQNNRPPLTQASSGKKRASKDIN